MAGPAFDGVKALGKMSGSIADNIATKISANCGRSKAKSNKIRELSGRTNVFVLA